MKPFPEQHSVLVMDNCRIHHTDALQDVLNDLRMSYFFVKRICDAYAFDRDHAVVLTTVFAGPESD